MASNYFDKASLVMIPDAPLEGKVLSVKPEDRSGDFTFTRGSNLAATRVDANGLIEKGRENLLLQSNQFDTTWSAVSGTITSGQSGYDGSNDAWLFERTAAGGSMRQSVSLSGVQTTSVYAKGGSLNWMAFVSGGSLTAYFDLQNGALGTVSAAVIEAKIESVGNGWYRCSITQDVSLTEVRIYPALGDFDLSANGTIYIQDAQLEKGLVATDYIETGASTSQAGILEDLPRLDYTDSSCPALLLEPLRTNLVSNSELLDTLNQTNADISISPDLSPEGVYNANRAERVTGSQVGQSFSITSGVDYTNSIYAKSVSGSGKIQIVNMQGESTEFNITSEWQRYSLTDESTSTTGRCYVRLWAIGDIVDFYGLQCEQGSYATSYIPTYGSSVSRVAETCTDAGTSATFNSTEGVLYFEGSAISGNDSTFKRIAIGTSDDNFVNNINIRYNTDGVSVTYQYRVGSVYQADLTIPINQTDVNKIACVWKVNRFEIWLNGVKAAEDTSGSVISANTLDTMYYGKTTTFSEPLYGKTNQVLVFPTALSDEELAALTTI